MSWENVAEEMDKLNIAMERLKVACENITRTWEELIEWNETLVNK